MLLKSLCFKSSTLEMDISFSVKSLIAAKDIKISLLPNKASGWNKNETKFYK